MFSKRERCVEDKRLCYEFTKSNLIQGLLVPFILLVHSCEATGRYPILLKSTGPSLLRFSLEYHRFKESGNNGYKQRTNSGVSPKGRSRSALAYSLPLKVGGEGSDGKTLLGFEDTV